MPAQLAMLTHWEIIVVLVIALLLFGTRLPKVARSLGQGVREFKGGVSDVQKDLDEAGKEPVETKEGQ